MRCWRRRKSSMNAATDDELKHEATKDHEEIGAVG